jgi:hypothetical protein
MNPTDFEKLRTVLLQDAERLSERKGADYAEEADVLANFKNTAKALGITEHQAWAVHFCKHTSAVLSYCKKGNVASEPIRDRLIDVINYAVLLWALSEEKK